MMLNIIIGFWPYLILFAIIILYRIFRPRIKGAIGEKTIAIVLSTLGRSRYKVINNVVLDVNGWTAQIDHLVISDFGIFVIETKNYKGWILGGEHAEYWTQVIYKRKEKLYNPIRQNQSHIKALKHYLRDFPCIPYIPIVVFSRKATLKVRTISEVTYSYNLLSVIKKYKEVVLNEQEKNEIYDQIHAVNSKATYNRRQHVALIKQRVTEKKDSIRQNQCPYCGGSLLVRKGKYGEFRGCSNFPKCRFTIGY